MTQLPVKKRRRLQAETAQLAKVESAGRFPGVVLCVVEKRMGRTRREFLTSLASSRGFCVEDACSANVTHVVSEGNSGDEVVEWLKRNGRSPGDAAGSGPILLDLSWFTESMGAGLPVEIEPRHLLKVTAHAKTTEDQGQVPVYACQRRTPLLHHNLALTEVLETMAEEAKFCGSDARNLAYSRAASVLKSLPWSIRKIQQLHAVPCIGEHSRKIIQEVLEDGRSPEVEQVRTSERYKTMKEKPRLFPSYGYGAVMLQVRKGNCRGHLLFTKIFGVGVKAASQWYREGLRTLADLKMHHIKLNKAQEAGFLHYEDLNTPVERLEAEAICQKVVQVVQLFSPDASVTLAGGFRRGKPHGHDVDLLITHPSEGQEVGLLQKVISSLERQGFLLYHSTHRNALQDLEDEELWVAGGSGTMDRFERCLSIFRLGDPAGRDEGDTGPQQLGNSVGVRAPGLWKAVRVDLVVIPCSQFPFALLGWTGSKNFERDLRRFCKHERKMSLNSHGLYHLEQKIFLPAASEEEIFQHLGLEYIVPEERNA